MPAWTSAGFSEPPPPRAPRPARASDRIWRHPLTRPALWALCAAPMVWLLVAAFTDRLGANPAEALLRGLGDWTLRGLCLTLAVTPLRTLVGWPSLARYRRLLGLWTFAYASLHLLAYIWLDMGWALADVWADTVRRPFITVGMAAWLCLLALAVTSWPALVRAMGARRWQALHRAVYAVAALAILHFSWMRAGKNDQAEVWVYAAVLTLLLGWRLWRWVAARPRQRQATPKG